MQVGGLVEGVCWWVGWRPGLKGENLPSKHIYHMTAMGPSVCALPSAKYFCTLGELVPGVDQRLP